MISKSLTSMRISPENRVLIFDYLRALMVLFVVLEHALLPYSTLYKTSAYVPDFGGNILFDIFHLHNDAIMMPFLFFVAGIFVFPSLDRRGIKSFLTEKLYRLVIPYTVGVFILVPPQTYCRYLAKREGTLDFLDYYQQVYLWDDLWSSGFWFIGYLIILMAGIILIRSILPGFVSLWGRIVKWVFENPIKGYLAFFILSALLIGSGYLYWGPKWVQFFPSLSVRGERLIEKIIFFLLGIGFAQANFHSRLDILQQIGQRWKNAFIFAALAFIVYATFTLTNFYEGIYNYEYLRFRMGGGGSFEESLNILKEYAPPVLMRTTLLALTMTALAFAYLTAFCRFMNRPLDFWKSLAAASFSIYVFHETLQVPLSYFFTGIDANEFVKFFCVVALSWGGSWGLYYLLRNQPVFKKIL